MKGFPLQNLILLLLALAALTVPLLRVDRPPPGRASDAVSAPATGDAIQVMLRLRLVHLPLALSLTVEGKPVLLEGTGLERQATTTLSGSGAALELELKGTWPPGTPGTMVELHAAPDGMPEQVQNVWAEAGAAEEMVRFTWRGRP